jgi:histidine triad (HIT) family protein
LTGRGDPGDDPRCLFCKIVRRELPADEVLRTDRVVAFRDLNPKAPTHLLVVPTFHVTNFTEFVARAEPADCAQLLAAASDLGSRFGERGYRVVINEGRDGGQTVFHLHLHVLAGRRMNWPPG